MLEAGNVAGYRNPDSCAWDATRSQWQHRLQVEEVIIAQQSISPVAVVIVEPIQSEGGDNHASPAFFQGLRDVSAR